MNKMLKLTNPRLRRLDVVVNSFHSSVSNTSEKFSRTPEMSFSKIISQPRMFLKNLKSGITFKQLKSLAHTHGRRKFNKQVDMINSDVKFIDFTSLPVSNLSEEKFTIHSKPVEFERISGIFRFPHEVEGVLSEAMFSGFQFHFLSPKPAQGDRAHANFVFYSGGLVSNPPNNDQSEEINLMEDGDSSPNLKIWVSSP
jgi:hypothetical protein